jgi:uncharacterized iron-regulated protein
MITEEKMAAYLNGIHLSDNFQAHNINLQENSFDLNTTYNINLSPQELEERLKNAQRITLDENVKKSFIETSRSEIYKVLANRMEKPCQALVLWQPPQPLKRLITDFDTNNSNLNNNNNSVKERVTEDNDENDNMNEKMDE